MHRLRRGHAAVGRTYFGGSSLWWVLLLQVQPHDPLYPLSCTTPCHLGNSHWIWRKYSGTVEEWGVKWKVKIDWKTFIKTRKTSIAIGEEKTQTWQNTVSCYSFCISIYNIPVTCFFNFSISSFKLLISKSLLAVIGPSTVEYCRACTVWVDSRKRWKREGRITVWHLKRSKRYYWWIKACQKILH